MPILGLATDQFPPGQITRHLRHPRLQSLIERRAGAHRYQITELSWHAVLFLTRTYARLVQPGLAQTVPIAPPLGSPIHRRFDQRELAMVDWVARASLAG